jgi:hypothetical protein
VSYINLPLLKRTRPRVIPWLIWWKIFKSIYHIECWGYCHVLWKINDICIVVYLLKYIVWTILLVDDQETPISCITPAEFFLLHALSNRCHDAAKISNQPSVEGCQIMETSYFTYWLGCWQISDRFHLLFIHTDYKSEEV